MNSIFRFHRRRAVAVSLPGLTALLLAAALLGGCETNGPTQPPIVSVPLDSIRISPDTLTLAVGSAVRISAAAWDTTGALVAVSFAWSSSAPGVFGVDGTGRVAGASEGSGYVYAAAGGAIDSAVVIVISSVPGWVAQESNVTGNDLLGVHFLPDARTGWAVGTVGRIVRTTDAGATWTTQPSGTNLDLQAVWFTSATNGWAVGSAGVVLQTTNGGSSWTRRTNVGAIENLADVHFASANLGWIVGDNGIVLRTTNGGTSWSRLTPTTFNLNSVSFAGAAEGWAVGNGGVILGTRNGGSSWRVVQPFVTSQPLRAVWRNSTARAFAAGAAGVTPRTVAVADSAQWELRNAGASLALEGVCFPVAQVGWAVGLSGTGAILRSHDAGVTWTPQNANTQYRLNDVFFVDDERGWVVGDNGTILHTGNGGEL